MPIWSSLKLLECAIMVQIRGKTLGQNLIFEHFFELKMDPLVLPTLYQTHSFISVIRRCCSSICTIIRDDIMWSAFIVRNSTVFYKESHSRNWIWIIDFKENSFTNDNGIFSRCSDEFTLTDFLKINKVIIGGGQSKVSSTTSEVLYYLKNLKSGSLWCSDHEVQFILEWTNSIWSFSGDFICCDLMICRNSRNNWWKITSEVNCGIWEENKSCCAFSHLESIWETENRVNIEGETFEIKIVCDISLSRQGYFPII